MMSRDFRDTASEHAACEPAFVMAMLDEAATAFLNGKPHVARLILRDLCNASVRSEGLAIDANRPSKSLRQMLSGKGGPRRYSLAAVFRVIGRRLGARRDARCS